MLQVTGLQQSDANLHRPHFLALSPSQGYEASMIRLILIVPFLLALVFFAASNQESTQMWLLAYGWSCSIGVLALLVAAVSFLLGAFSVWIVELGQRRRARRAEAKVRELEATLAAQEAQLRVQPHSPPSAPAAVPTMPPPL